MLATGSVKMKLPLSHTTEDKTEVSHSVLMPETKYRISKKENAVENSSDNRNHNSCEEKNVESPRSVIEKGDRGTFREYDISPRSEYNKTDAEHILSEARELVSRRRFRCSPKPNMLERIWNTESYKISARCSQIRPFTANPISKKQHAIRPMTAAAVTRDLLCRSRSGRKSRQTDDHIRPLSTFSERVSVTSVQRSRSSSTGRKLTLEIDWLVKKRQIMQQQRDAVVQLQEDEEEEISEEEKQSRHKNRHQVTLKIIYLLVCVFWCMPKIVIAINAYAT